MLHPARLIVTGHDEQGCSRVESDEAATSLGFDPAFPDEGLIDFWITGGGLGQYGGPAEVRPPLLPPSDGSRFRFFQIAPESASATRSREERIERTRRAYAALGAVDAYVDPARHPAMHKTCTLDYIVLLKGEIVLMLDVGEVAMKPFDVVVQRGTNHGWVNHGNQPALLMAVLLDAA